MQPTHEELNRWDREIVWHAFTQMAEYEPLIIQRGQGCRLIDLDGNKYIDGVSSMWCNVHGHCHPRLDAALREQLNQIAHCTSLGMSNPTTIQLARRLVDLTPDGLRHVFFSSDGSSCVEVALKMAFQYWRQCEDPQPRKSKFIALGEAYHGDTLGSVSVGGVARFHALFEPLLFDVVRVPVPDTYRTADNLHGEALLDFHLERLEALFLQHHHEIAGMIVEPLVQGAAGMIAHPPGYLRGARKLTEQFDVLLIVDEIATGFGRTGTMFACEQEQVSPDIMCLGKGLTAGYLPMAATLATDRIWQAFLGRYDQGRTLFHGHTFGGNPLCAAVALASLDVFDDEQTLEKLPEKTAMLGEHLQRIADHPHVGHTRQCGLLAGIELVRDRAEKTPYPWEEKRGLRVCEHALNKGVWLRPLGNVVVVMPPLAISPDELNTIMSAVEEGIAVATKDD